MTIPFEKRHEVVALPCLYLGGSLYICWVELGQSQLITALTHSCHLFDTLLHQALEEAVA
jgi:hypothetical protein